VVLAIPVKLVTEPKEVWLRDEYMLSDRFASDVDVMNVP
jgi:hypothetical protein